MTVIFRFMDAFQGIFITRRERKTSAMSDDLKFYTSPEYLDYFVSDKENFRNDFKNICGDLNKSVDKCKKENNL